MHDCESVSVISDSQLSLLVGCDLQIYITLEWNV